MTPALPLLVLLVVAPPTYDGDWRRGCAALQGMDTYEEGETGTVAALVDDFRVDIEGEDGKRLRFRLAGVTRVADETLRKSAKQMMASLVLGRAVRTRAFNQQRHPLKEGILTQG